MASGSRRWVVPTVIGVVVLSILIGVLGWKLGERDARNLVQTPIGGLNNSPTDGSSPTAGSEKACPDPTVQAASDAGAKGAVTQVLYIETEKAEVWICHDTAGTLYYQGHSEHGAFTKATSNNTLFLTDVKVDGDAYVATNTVNDKHTIYRVTTIELTVSDDNGVKFSQPVIRHDP